MKDTCELCIGRGKIWEEEGFYGLICHTHHQPMIVLKDHRPSLTDDERAIADRIRLNRYPLLRFRGNMKSITDHWHDHFI